MKKKNIWKMDSSNRVNTKKTEENKNTHQWKITYSDDDTELIEIDCIFCALEDAIQNGKYASKDQDNVYIKKVEIVL